MELAAPWALTLLPLPWLLAWRRSEGSQRIAAGAIRWPHWKEVSALAAKLAPRRNFPGWLPGLAWLLLCLAAARPVEWSEQMPTQRSGRELMLAVDVSGSMAADDMVIGGRRVDRLTAVKAVAGDFLERRQGDRVGLILFGQQAFLMTPLTLDLASVRYQLDTSAIGLAGRETAIGDAIGLAVKRLRERPEAERVLVLLTDGVNTAGALDPESATQLAVQHGLRVHTIGMGSEDGGRSGLFGLMMPATGAEIDEAMLTSIAERTGGRYFRARNARELAEIYAELDRLEPLPESASPVRLQRERFMLPLAAGLAVLMLAWALPRWPRKTGQGA
ncbi:vWA domain-containing protein [Pseudomarimonas salicorniae]|uniref:VWA domain-containing protein n=1 Tax=Pseudomarimonas salicorniae TaxID=2933270 RepID=A0ABT0GJ53_9GAMM|nr:VWA domain-containing protein [Lysobacter sp. CAU 1642]MCK7594562.1 VWA domain-containing protein [Lysobacter sp. CAU 1642]